MKYLLIILSILSANSVGAQDTFFKLVDGWVGNYCVEMEDSYLYLGVSTNGNWGQHILLFNELDEVGNTFHQVDFKPDSVYSIGTWNKRHDQIATKIDEQNYMITSYYQDSLSLPLASTMILNYNIVTEEFSLIGDYSFQNSSLFFTNIIKSNDSTIYAGGFRDMVPTDNALIYNLDMQGEERWHAEFGCGSNCPRRVQQILPLSNGNVAVLIQEYDNGHPFYEERQRAVLIVLDSEGEMVWEEEVYPGDEENFKIWGGGMLEVDGELLVAYTNPYEYWSTGEAWFNYENTVFLDRFQLDGEYVSTHSYENEIPNDNGPVSIGRYLYRVCQMQKLEDGNILISGTTGHGGLLLKINTEGEVIWNREHFPHEFEANDDAIHWFTIYLCTTPTSDGGYMMAGQYDSSPSELFPGGIQTAIAVKVDQYGCLEEGCQVGIFEQSMEHLELNVYPNPSTGIFQIELPSENEVYSLKVYNMVGEEIRQALNVRGFEYILDMSGVAAGVYLLQMMGADGVVYVERIGVED